VTKLFGVRALSGGTPNARQVASLLTIGKIRRKFSTPRDMYRLDTVDENSGEATSITLVEQESPADTAEYWAEEAAAQIQELQRQSDR
jgi:hypothetical protein